MLKLGLKMLVELTGNPFTSKLLRKITSSKWSRKIIPLFAKVYKINQEEMKLPYSEYRSLKHFFTRYLKEEVRPIDQGEQIIVSPVDGVINQFGLVKDVETLEIKKKDMLFEEMLGSKEIASKYEHGKYIVFYLSPQHYHRIHSPIQGKIKNKWELGGKSYPVNQFGLKYGKRPLSTNYRRITEIETTTKDIAVVKVGALNVNSIHLTKEDDGVQRGEEMAYFSFGSTVILLIENGEYQFCDELYQGKEMKYGERILESP